MVVKGRFSRKAPPAEITIPKLYNKNIHNIAALKRKPRQQEALNILYDIANLVTPIMKEYGFTVKNLCEFFPKTDNLLGMNMNHGYKIFLRLRPPFNDNVFLPKDELIGTMLHELTHNKHGPHDAKFYKLLDELTNKQEIIMIRGGPVFEQDPFAGLGKQLGGVSSSSARDARLKRLDIKFTGSVQKLGGDDLSGEPKPKDLKELVRQAAIKRFEDNKWCHDPIKGDLPQDDELDMIEIDSDDDESGNDNSDNDIISSKRRQIDKIGSEEHKPNTSKTSSRSTTILAKSKANGKQDQKEVVVLDLSDEETTNSEPQSRPQSTLEKEPKEVIDLTGD